MLLRCFYVFDKPQSSSAVRRSFPDKMSNKTALVILGSGAEEMELVVTVDVLRRAGITVTLASLNSEVNVKCSRNVVIVADNSLDQVADDNFDAIVLPGGLGGTEAMSASKLLGSVLQRQQQSDRVIAAICAAPCALLHHSVALGKRLTSYPAMKTKLVDAYEYVDDAVVQDGKLLTSRGPGTSMLFALRLAELLAGVEKAQEVAKGMLLNSDYTLS